MPFRELTITPRHTGGPLAEAVRCDAGRVSVFRGSERALDAVRGALRAPGGAAIEVTVDGRPFVPELHNFVGFGEQVDAPSSLDYLECHGISRQEAERLLAANNLRGAAERPLRSLTPVELRMVLLLGAMLERDKVLVLDDPFAGFTDAQRDQFAMRLCEFASRTGGLVLVTQLNERPEYWIDNDLVSRIELGARVDRTVGDAADAMNLQRIVKEVQQAMLQERAPALRREKIRRVVYAVSAALMIALLSKLAFGRRNAPGERATADRVPAAAATPAEAGAQPPDGGLPHGAPHTSEAPQESAEHGAPPAERGPFTAPDHALSRYPASIQNSVQRAFEEAAAEKNASPPGGAP